MISILCNRLCVLNKIKDVNIIAFKTITGFNLNKIKLQDWITHYDVTKSQTELLTLKFYYFEIFGVNNSMWEKRKYSFRGNSRFLNSIRVTNSKN